MKPCPLLSPRRHPALLLVQALVAACTRAPRNSAKGGQTEGRGREAPSKGIYTPLRFRAHARKNGKLACHHACARMCDVRRQEPGTWKGSKPSAKHTTYYITHTHIHTHTHTHRERERETYIHTYMHTHTHMHTHTYTLTHSLTHSHTHTHSLSLSHTHTHTLSHTHIMYV